ncbi:corticosteroid-binding globulin-like [Sorex fumeus]|uniref:corticosteroid-binding globulin-like n=1 Tax=Sorex fumeus TaxID=62283 RepID=UPI0024AC8694|nr:corticosteroid-binding globulin-like [Sorex fumeus]
MLLTLYTCLLLLMTSGLWTIRAQDTNETVNIRSHFRKLAPSNIHFAFKLFEYLNFFATHKNVFFSPISISLALSMMAFGADKETGTKILEGIGFKYSPIPKTEIFDSFLELHHFLRQSDNNFEMSMGNTLFFKENSRPWDLSTNNIKLYYGMENVAIDFKNWTRSIGQINEYMQNKIWGDVTDLLYALKDPSPYTLLNYNIFTGLWAQGFDPNNTKEENFFVDDKTVLKVPMMTQKRFFNLLYDRDLGCIVVLLKNIGNKTTLLVLQNRNKLDWLINQLTEATLIRWFQSIITSYLEVHIPRLSLSGTYELGDAMNALGIVDLKKEQTNLFGITGCSKEKLSKMLHVAKLEITENGMEPEVPIDDSVYRELTPTIIRFDRPFLIMVFDKVSWSFLFLGKVIYAV